MIQNSTKKYYSMVECNKEKGKYHLIVENVEVIKQK